MKSLTKYLNEKLIINKDYKYANEYTCAPKTFNELRKIIEDRYNKLGPGTKNNPIDFNDVDVSNIESFYNKNTNNGIFQQTKFKYIDISYWNVSNIKSMRSMFVICHNLESVGDLSDWNVSNVVFMDNMFINCHNLKSVGDLSDWDVSNVKDMTVMFSDCEQLKSVGDLSNWDVSKVEYMNSMFYSCEQLISIGILTHSKVSKVKNMSYMFYACMQLKSVGDLSNWNVSKVKNTFGMFCMFNKSGITNIPDWYYR